MATVTIDQASRFSDQLVEASSWDVNEATSPRDAAHTVVPHESGLGLQAVNEHGALVPGVRS